MLCSCLSVKGWFNLSFFRVCLEHSSEENNSVELLHNDTHGIISLCSENCGLAAYTKYYLLTSKGLLPQR